MARNFNGSSQYLEVAAAPASAHPLTIACWFRSGVQDDDRCMVQIEDASETAYYWFLGAGGASNDQVSAYSVAVSYSNALSTGTWSTNTWHHAAGVFASSTSRYAYLDGTPGSEDTGDHDPGKRTPDQVSIGRQGDASPGDYWSGQLAEVAVWDAALTTVEIQQLAAGFSPLFVRPQNLVAYWPLIRDADNDIVGGHSTTAYNTPTVAAHPRVIYPGRFLIIPSGATAGGGESIVNQSTAYSLLMRKRRNKSGWFLG